MTGKPSDRRLLTQHSLLITALLAGCAPKPRAPALETGPVYENAKEGVQFVVPEGWVQFARSDTPPGKLTHPVMLVNYQIPNPGRQTELELNVVDLPADADVAAYFTEHAFGSSRWDPKGPPQSLQVGGAQAARYRYARRDGKTEFVREVVAVRRGERVFLFIYAAPAGDDTSPDQWRQLLASVRWTK